MKLHLRIKPILGILFLMVAVIPLVGLGQMITTGSASVQACPSFPTPPATITNIVLDETANTNITCTPTLVITAPAGFQFVNAGTVTDNDGDVASITSTLTNSTTITYTFICEGGNTTNEDDIITLTGIQIIGIGPSAGSGNVTVSTETGFAGFNVGAIFATLTSSTGTPPTTSTNGGNQVLATCATSTTLTGNTPVTGTGTWTVSPSAGVTFSPSANTPNAIASGMTPGTLYTFTWTIANSPCTASASNLTITTSIGPGCWDYCDVTWSDNPADDWISNVTFNTINNNSGANTNGYGSFTGTCTPVILSSTHQLCVTVTVVAAFTQHVFAYFDWNNDGDFSDAGESIDLGQVTGTGTLCANITIPAGATLGNTTMRIVEKYNTNPVSACESGTYGETEDYCVTIITCTTTVPNAGADQPLAACATSTNLAGNTITQGTGMWTLVSGSGDIADPSNPTSAVTNLEAGTNIFEWQVTDGSCPVLSDQVTITTSGLPSTANAGPDLGGCPTSQTMAATVPTSGTGTWTMISGCGTAASPNSATSVINGLCTGENVWEWTVVNAACPLLSSSDQVTVTVASAVTTANAGADQSGICYSAGSPGITVLNGNTPVVGTGTWTIVSNTTGGSISNVNDPTSNITGINSTGTMTLTWTIASAGCTSSTDNISITSVLCNGDEPCTALGLAVTSGTCSYSTYSNTGLTVSTGMPEPGCAAVNGPDIWFAVTVPPSGQLQISGQVQGTFDPLISIYDGTCGSLAFSGCVNGPSGTNVYPLTYAGAPGSVVYIRVNEGGTGDATTGSFGVCAYEATTPTISQVLPGVTTYVTCGTPLNFYDPGGEGGTTTTSTLQPPPAGNYTNNTGAQWEICPSSPTDIVSINFTEFTVENGFDKVIILSNDIVIAQWTANDGQGDIVTAMAPGECLTVVLQSDYIWTAEGWEAIVSCTTAVVPAQITNACQVNNCNGECGVWVCADGIYDTQAGAGAGIDEINEVTGGCWGAAGEVATSWFYFTTSSAGELEFEFVPSNNGHNINFALYGPSLDGTPPCPLSTGDAPIRCSFASDGGINTGLQAGQTDLYDISTGDGMSAPLTVAAGQTYALVVDVYQNGQPPTETEINFNGVVTLDCTPLALPITLVDFQGINQGERNLLSWTVSSQMSNDYFTVERSVNGSDWEIVGIVNGAGNSQEMMYYSLPDLNPYFPISYYRLKQTDTDGEFSFSKVIAISAMKESGEFISNLFPNPSAEYATFTYNGNDTKTPLNVRVYNEFGQIVSEITYLDVYKGMPSTLKTFNLSNGMYKVLFTQGEATQTQKLTIIR